MSIINDLIEKARGKSKKVVYPEGTDVRVLTGAAKAKSEGIVLEAILIGIENDIKKVATENNIDISDLTIVEPEKNINFESFTNTYFELRKHKGISIEDAKKKILDPLNYAAMMVREGYADGSVGGAVYTTGSVIVSAAQILGTEEGVDVISSSFLMVMPNYLGSGESKALIYGDCGVNPNPNASQLASIAYSCSKMYEKLVGETPKVGMLSFSTKGSGRHEDVTKVADAVKLIHKRYPDLQADGELQLDAAIVPSIGAKKAPDSKVAGEANVLIFPDLDAGNIGYKLTERLANADAMGPLLQGVAKPFMDLSRGCSAEDIYNVTSVAVNLAE